MEISVVLEKSDEGGYTVHVPALPACISEGKTKEEALKNIAEAITLYFDLDLQEDFKVPRDAIVEKIKL